MHKKTWVWVRWAKVFHRAWNSNVVFRVTECGRDVPFEPIHPRGIYKQDVRVRPPKNKPLCKICLASMPKSV